MAPGFCCACLSPRLGTPTSGRERGRGGGSFREWKCLCVWAGLRARSGVWFLPPRGESVVGTEGDGDWRTRWTVPPQWLTRFPTCVSEWALLELGESETVSATLGLPQRWWMLSWMLSWRLSWRCLTPGPGPALSLPKWEILGVAAAGGSGPGHARLSDTGSVHSQVGLGF